MNEKFLYQMSSQQKLMAGEGEDAEVSPKEIKKDLRRLLRPFPLRLTYTIPNTIGLWRLINSIVTLGKMVIYLSATRSSSLVNSIYSAARTGEKIIQKKTLDVLQGSLLDGFIQICHHPEVRKIFGSRMQVKSLQVFF